jgi:serine O-acetyltransferase
MRLLQLPLAVVARRSSAWRAIERDVQRFRQPRLDLPVPVVGRKDLLAACAHRPFRTILYARLKSAGLGGRIAQRLLRGMYKGQVALEIACGDIGPGLYIGHGMATIVVASRIGTDCQISQQVTIGYSDKGGPPTLGDRVRVGAGAIVIGPVHLADDAVIGAGAVVVDDVGPATVVGGVPARPLPGAADAFSAAKSDSRDS